ncbi:MAG TPA: radical SAM protein [Candidatus Brocadiales bacterium]|nr:radical SAM protein [Candidatus Brocadiales bacterium]
MKTTLLFPPSWHPSQPYLSLPALTGFLRREGIDVTQRDINIEFLEVLLNKDNHEHFLERIANRLAKRSSTGEKEDYSSLISALEEIPVVASKLDEAKAVLRGEGFYDSNQYMESLGNIGKWLNLISHAYYPSELTLVGNNLTNYSVYSSKDVFEAINNEKENIFLDIFRKHFLKSILADEPGLVGISVTSTSQIIPAFTMARLIKEAKKDIHITIGGGVFTRLIDNIFKQDALFSFIDSFVVYEGEHALLTLIRELEDKRDFTKVPNLVYRHNGRTALNEPLIVEDVDYLPTPDYDGFPLSLYFTPKLVLPVQTSRGCYYKKCAFCNLHVDQMVFRTRKVDTVVEDIQKLSKKYNTKYFFITDEAMPLPTLKKFSTRITEDKIDIKWITGMRFENKLDAGLIEKASKAGCLKFVFGLESSNQRVLDMMKKGIQRETVDRIIKDCLEKEMAVHVYLITGFPTETRDEAIESVDYILNNEALVNSLGFSCQPSLFELEKSSPIMDLPPSYGITKIMEPKGHDLSLGYRYEVDKGMTPKEAEETYNQIMDKTYEKVSPFPFTYSMSDGLLYIARSKGDGISVQGAEAEGQKETTISQET